MGWIENITDQLKQAREQRQAEAMMVQTQQQQMAEQARDMLSKGFTASGGGVVAAPSPHAAPGPGSSFMDRLKHGARESFDTRQRLPQIIQPTYTPDPATHPELAATGRQAANIAHESRWDEVLKGQYEDDDERRDFELGLDKRFAYNKKYHEETLSGLTVEQAQVELERTRKMMDYFDRHQEATVRRAELEREQLEFSLKNDREMIEVRNELERLGLTAEKLKVTRSGLSTLETSDGRLLAMQFNPDGTFAIEHLHQFDPLTSPIEYHNAEMNRLWQHAATAQELGETDLYEDIINEIKMMSAMAAPIKAEGVESETTAQPAGVVVGEIKGVGPTEDEEPAPSESGTAPRFDWLGKPMPAGHGVLKPDEQRSSGQAAQVDPAQDPKYRGGTVDGLTEEEAASYKSIEKELSKPKSGSARSRGKRKSDLQKQKQELDRLIKERTTEWVGSGRTGNRKFIPYKEPEVAVKEPASAPTPKKKEEKVASTSMSSMVSGLSKRLPMGQDYSGTNLTQKNINPGNIKYKAGGVANKYAKKDANGEPMRDRHGHLIFENAEMGWRALIEDLSAKWGGRSATNKTWVPKGATLRILGEGTNPGMKGNRRYATDPAWADSVSKILGVSVETKLQDIPLEQLAGAIAQQEGWTSTNKSEFRGHRRF